MIQSRHFIPRPEKNILQSSKLEESRNNSYVRSIIYMLLHFHSPLGTRFPFDGHVQNALLSSYHPIGHRCRKLSPIVFSEIEMSHGSSPSKKKVNDHGDHHL